MAVEDEIREIKRRITQKQQQAMRSQVERETAQKALDGARRALREEFDVEDPAQARAVLAGLQGDLDAALAAAREALER